MICIEECILTMYPPVYYMYCVHMSHAHLVHAHHCVPPYNMNSTNACSSSVTPYILGTLLAWS